MILLPLIIILYNFRYYDLSLVYRWTIITTIIFIGLLLISKTINAIQKLHKDM